MHPGYSFTGDNVDMRILPRQMTLTNKNKDHHMYQMVAFKNRISSNHLPNISPKNDASQVLFSSFLPNAEEQSTLIEELIILIGHVWGKFIPSLAWFTECLPKQIVHAQMENTKKKTEKVHLGVLQKNEQHEEDMIDILEFLLPYVPCHDSGTTGKPVKVLSGGDYLTFERHKEAQSSMQDARTPLSRLEGLIPKVEDFHTQAEWMKVTWHHLYDTISSRDKGTLYAARNMIDARNVTDNPHNNFYACSEFLNKVTRAYLICGALHHFGMEKNVGFHSKMYFRPSALRKHEEREHRFEAVQSNPTSQTNASSDADRVYNYTRQALLLLPLRMDHEDAIKLGDGERVLRLYKFFCLFYKVSNCPKYAIAMLNLQARVKCLLSPRLAHSLTWNIFVNHQGQIDTNFPMDKEIEHDNLAFKTDIHSFKGEITDRSIARVSHSTGPTNEILSAYDNSTDIRKPPGKHTKMSTEDDVMTLVDQFIEVDLYNSIAGRKHSAFSDMKQNLLADINVEDLKSWISKSLKTFSRKHFYKL
ncbi:uncharacterized protein LOC111324048 [Stylophora pistillata]|uniref:uncharacterized protein LOC111324048 n=1 Tax=Stylophora pistillata TaxID=50429 RepID=UPI000C04476E|nr:uncharacterized protein LOC111324048 [Stylophora pistillata]